MMTLYNHILHLDIYSPLKNFYEFFLETIFLENFYVVVIEKIRKGKQTIFYYIFYGLTRSVI